MQNTHNIDFQQTRMCTKSKVPRDEHKTFIWWCLLICIAMLNIGLWFWTALVVPAEDPYQRAHLYLSGVYVSVCAYRSILPRIDLERTCLFDKTISSMFLGRFAATIAELCFAMQIALFLHKLGSTHGHPMAVYVSFMLFPFIFIAQMCCWVGVLTLNNIWHAIEESIWAVSSSLFGLSLSSFIVYNTDKPKYLYNLAWAGVILSSLYFYFMVTVDVPMYLARWKTHNKNQKGKKSFLMTIRRGGRDAWSRRIVRWDWSFWKPEVAWLTLYFSTAVWVSLGLVHLPLNDDGVLSSV